MAKLFKEANRLKKVLSANVDHIAQVSTIQAEILKSVVFVVRQEKLAET